MKEENQLIKLDENNLSFPVNFAPAQIDFSGYSKMKDQIDQLRENLDKYDVTKGNLKEAKSTRAKFNDKVESLIDEIDFSSTKISDGIKVFEVQEKEERHENNFNHIAAMCELANVDPSKIKYQSSWDNKSYSKTKFEIEVDQQIALIKQQQDQFADNIKIISEKAEKLGLPADHWIKALDNYSLSDVLDGMEEYKNDLDAVSKAQKEAKLNRLNNLKKQGNKYVDPETGEIKDKIFSLKLKVKGTSRQLKQLQSFLKDNGIEYEGLEG